jgi:hypothetical protein
MGASVDSLYCAITTSDNLFNESELNKAYSSFASVWRREPPTLSLSGVIFCLSRE